MIVLASELAAAVALLLWSVRLIRTGVERAFIASVRRALKDIARNRLTAAAGGGAAAIVFQSSTAVALIAAGFSATGIIAPTAGLTLLLGAELGSALMVQVLLLPVAQIVPFILLAGVIAFFNAKSRRTKQIGRILVGFSLILISIGMLREVTAPIAQNEIVLAAAGYFERDLISAFAIGALLAWAMHSSLAAVLTFAAFAGAGLVALPVAVALVLGANFGGAVVPVTLLWSAERPARVMAAGNFLARGTVSVLAVVLLASGVLPIPSTSGSATQMVVLCHIGLNAVLVILILPIVGWPISLAERWLQETATPTDETVSALDPQALGTPRLALACAQRELLQMGENVQAMLVPIAGLFREWDDEVAMAIDRRESQVDRIHYETKIYLSQLSAADMPHEDQRKSVELVAMANNLEEAGDRIAVSLLSLARKMRDEGLAFSDEGLKDMERFHDQVVMNTQLALSVLTTGDAEAAQQLVAEKDRIRSEEQRLQERHLKRLQQNATASIQTTNIHQEALRLLKQVNASLSYVAYPIAEESGALLASRLANPQTAEGRG